MKTNQSDPKMLPGNLPFVLAFVFFILVSLCSFSIPFFWDSVYFSDAATRYFDHTSFFSPIDRTSDTGGFPLYSYWMAVSWKLFGKSLLVSHLAMFPFLVGTAYGYLRLGKKFLNDRMLLFSFLLLCLEPCFMTQSILMAYDMLMLCFFFLALNALLEKRKPAMMFFLILLVLSNVRGILLVGAIGLIHLLSDFKNEKKKIYFFIPYLPPLIVFAGWIFYHHYKTGWYMFSPERENTDEHLLNFSHFGKQFVLICWKLLDSGRIFLWLIFAGGTIYLLRSKQIFPEFRKLLYLIFVPLGLFMLFFIPISNPVSARYFMIIYLILCIGVCYIFQEINSKKMILMMVIACAGLVSGNFWIYPERFSNEWDTSLKVLPFFELETKMRKYISETIKNSAEVATQFPLTDNHEARFLCAGINFTNALSGPVNKFHYYLHSNVCNTDLLPQIEAMKKSWKLLKQFRKGEVYISLYENPEWNCDELGIVGHTHYKFLY